MCYVLHDGRIVDSKTKSDELCQKEHELMKTNIQASKWEGIPGVKSVFNIENFKEDSL